MHQDDVSLGIDVGSTNTKVVALRLADPGPTEVAVARIPTPTGGADLVRGVEDAVRRLLSRTGIRPVAVGIASMAETGIPLDAEGAPLGDLVRWDRPGAAPQTDAVDRSARFAATGVPVTAKTPIVMWRELRDRDPERWARLHRWAGAGDLVTLALTGSLVTDHTLAGRTGAYAVPPAGTGLADAFDPELLDGTGLTVERMPAVARPGTAAGAVSPAAAARTGLPAGIPVVVAGHDHSVVAWGLGARMPGTAAHSAGTTEAVLRVSAGPVDRAAALADGMSVLRTLDGDAELLLAGSTGAGSVIAHWRERGVEPVDTEPEAWPAAIVLPYPAGRQSPRPDPTARVRIVGRAGTELDPASLSPHDIAVASAAGLALQAHWMTVAVAAVLGEPPVARIAAAGTVARNPGWLAFKAALDPVALSRLNEPAAAAAGLRAAVVAGVADPASVLPLVDVPSRLAPDPALLDEFVAAATVPDLDREGAS